MVRKYIKRDWTDHKETTQYLSDEDEYVKLEIFSFDPKYTSAYSVEKNTLKGENVTKTNFKSYTSYISKDKINPMEFTCNYNVKESGLYRVDIVYEKNSHVYTDTDYNTNKDLTGWYDIYTKGSKTEHKAKVFSEIKTNNVPKQVLDAMNKTKKRNALTLANSSGTDKPDTSVSLKFEGEDNALKRKTIFKQFNKGNYNIEFGVPHNVYIFGVVIRKIIMFTGTNNDDAGTNLAFKQATFTQSEMTKPAELECTILHDDSFECKQYSSGLYFQYMDECNLYVRNLDNMEVRIFGGYISTPLLDTNRETISIHCADRLKDGENRYILNQLLLQHGDSEKTTQQYNADDSINFNRYSDVLKYLCRLMEVTLQNNIDGNYIEGEKRTNGKSITFGKNKKVKKIPVTNGQVTINKNHVVLRNNSSGAKKQVFTVYSSSKTGIDISDYQNIHLKVGLGDVKTPEKVKNTIEVNPEGNTANQKFSKCGVSQDKKYVMGIGMRGVGKYKSSYPYGTYYKSIFQNKCPYCGKPTLRWDSCREDSKCINGRTKRNFPVPAKETEITCTSCDCDFDVPTGYSKEGKYKYKLKKVSSTVKSSKSEQSKLHKGELTGIPTKNVKLSADDIFKAISKLCKGWKHSTNTGTTASYLEKHHVGDCWAWSDWISKQLKKYKVNHKIVKYSTGQSAEHRSVLYQNSKGNYVDFPYKKYGFPKGTYNTNKSLTAKTYYKYKDGGRINQAVAFGNSSNKTQETTIYNGYDKDNPFQAYIDIAFSTSSNKTNAKRHHVYLNFTQKASSDKNMKGLTPVWVNNTSKKISLNGFVQKLKEFYNCNKIYIQNIDFITPKIKSKNKNTWYTNDNSTIDNASCKMKLYGISFDNTLGVPASVLPATGKTVNEMIDSIVQDTDYVVSMTYAEHRSNDKINFRTNSSDTSVFTASEGDNNNILDWGNISYNPANELFNVSRCVFLQDKTNKYAYVESKNLDSVLLFQEQCSLITDNEGMGEKEAYWTATHNEKYNPESTYNYTLTVFGVPNVRLKDNVTVISDRQNLNTLKEVESISIKYDKSDKPVLRTELGLGEIAPDIQVTKNIRTLRNNAKKTNTYFEGSARPINDETIYEWED